jgi:hypothetical protein
MERLKAQEQMVDDADDALVRMHRRGGKSVIKVRGRREFSRPHGVVERLTQISSERCLEA